MTASGTFGFGIEFADFMNLNDLGAVVVKGTTLNPRSGNAGVRIAETPAGMLNCIGLENPGSDTFIKTILPQCKRYEFPVIVNMSGSTVEEYGVLAEKLSVDGVAALELNISCPNVKEGGIAFGTRPESAAAVVREVKKHTNLPVIVKLSPNVTDIVEMAKYVEDAGADIISMINTLLGMRIDVRTRRPVLHNNVGGLSGPAILPIAVRMIWQTANAVSIPIIGMGGVSTGEDAIELMMAGASAVQVGAAIFTDPYAPSKIVEEMNAFLDENKIAAVKDVIGTVKPW